jgi:hypothetical protein
MSIVWGLWPIGFSDSEIDIQICAAKPVGAKFVAATALCYFPLLGNGDRYEWLDL